MTPFDWFSFLLRLAGAGALASGVVLGGPGSRGAVGFGVGLGVGRAADEDYAGDQGTKS
jgi:hypothetical protein